MRKTMPLLLAVAACVQPAPAAKTPTADEAEAALQALVPHVRIAGSVPLRFSIRERMQHYGIPGVSIALIDDGKTRWIRGFGEASVGRPVASETPFMVKSLSKPLTAFAILRMAERGIFGLDAPVDSLLRRWQIPKDSFATVSAPTLRQILNHSAGFNMYGVPSYQPGQPVPTLIQALNGTSPAPPPGVRLIFEPGTRTAYSGGGYSVLQAVIEDATGDSFPDAMRRFALDELGMSASGYYVGIPLRLQESAAVGHRRTGQPLPYKWEGVIQMAAGGLVSNANDIAKFVVEANNAYQGKSKLLTRSSAVRMLTPTRGWGLGVEVHGNGDSLRFSHTGSGDGFKAILVGFPATGQGAVILTNSDAGAEFRYEVLRSLARAYGWPAFRQVERAAHRPSPTVITSVVGKYTFSDSSTADVVPDTAGTVMFKWGRQPSTRFWAENDSVFFNLANEELRFESPISGRFRRLTWSGSFGAFSADRLQP